MTEDKPGTLADLAHFTGTTKYHRHRILPVGKGLLLTDGANAVAKWFGAYWLMDTILLQSPEWLLEADGFCAIKLKVQGNLGLLITEDGDYNELARQSFTTDFPEPGVTLWLDARGAEEPVLMLPSEY